MSQTTTMRIDRDVLAKLQSLAKESHRSPQKYLRYLVEEVLPSKQDVAEQRRRLEIQARVDASNALEGIEPLTEGFAFELQQRWLKGEISIDEHGRLLADHYGYEYTE